MGNLSNKKLDNAIKSGDIKQVEILIPQCDSAYMVKNNTKFIHHAIQHDKYEILLLLIKSRRLFEYETHVSPIRIAMDLCNFPIINRLLDDGYCNANTIHKMDWWANYNNHYIHMIMNRIYDLSTPSNINHWFVYYSVVTNNKKLLIRCINDGVDINIHKKIIFEQLLFDYTPVMSACIRCHVEMVNILLDSKCDVDYKDDDGCNLLMIACFKGYSNIVMRLLHQGCNPIIETNTPKCPYNLSSPAIKFFKEHRQYPILLLLENKEYDTITYILNYYDCKDFLKIYGDKIFATACADAHLELMRQTFMYNNDKYMVIDSNAKQWMEYKNIPIPWEDVEYKKFDEYTFDELKHKVVTLHNTNRKYKNEKSYMLLLSKHLELNTSYLVCDYL